MVLKRDADEKEEKTGSDTHSTNAQNKTIVVTTDKNIYPDPSVRDKQADSNNYVIDGDESHA